MTKEELELLAASNPREFQRANLLHVITSSDETLNSEPDAMDELFGNPQRDPESRRREARDTYVKLFGSESIAFDDLDDAIDHVEPGAY